MQAIPVDPKLPARFDSTPNESRPKSHLRWWFRPYIETYSVERWDRHYAALDSVEAREDWKNEGREKWLQAWPGGTRYDVRCLDGGAWDRSTCWGSFATLDEAIECANGGPTWRDNPRKLCARPCAGAIGPLCPYCDRVLRVRSLLGAFV